jgi:hypothetical protein
LLGWRDSSDLGGIRLQRAIQSTKRLISSTNSGSHLSEELVALRDFLSEIKIIRFDPSSRHRAGEARLTLSTESGNRGCNRDHFVHLPGAVQGDVATGSDHPS